MTRHSESVTTSPADDRHRPRTVHLDLTFDDFMLLAAALNRYAIWVDEHSLEDDRRSHPQSQVDAVRASAQRVRTTLETAWEAGDVH